MTFTRTSSGLSSLHHFVGVDIIVYIEGKNITADKNSAVIDEDAYDTKFYAALFNSLSLKKVKIYIAGNKSNTLDYHDRIVSGRINNQVVFVDRDYSDILGYSINSSKLLCTKGYSWENDFWSKKLCIHLISMFTVSNQSATYEFLRRITRCARRLAILYKMNILMIQKGSFLFKISDKGGSIGVNIDPCCSFGISKDEFSRLAKKASGILTYSEVASFHKNNKYDCFSIMQGHFLEFLVLKLSSAACRKHSNANSNIDFNAMKNVAMSCFITNPTLFMPSKVINHYQKFISKL